MNTDHPRKLIQNRTQWIQEQKPIHLEAQCDLKGATVIILFIYLT